METYDRLNGHCVLFNDFEFDSDRCLLRDLANLVAAKVIEQGAS